MEEETINVSDLEKEEAQEEVETPEEVSDDESGETEEQETTEDSEENENEDDGNEDVEWDEWRSQYDLPDSIDSPEKLAESYNESLKEMKRTQSADAKLQQLDTFLKFQGHSGVDGLLSGQALPQSQPQNAQEKPTAQDSYFPESPATKLFKDMIQSGQVSEDNRESWASIAGFLDRAYGPQFKMAEQVMTTAMQQVVGLRDALRGMEWGQLDENMKGLINRKQVDDLLDRGLVNTVAEAVQFIQFRNPELIKQLTNKAEQRGKQQAKKKLRHSKALRRNRQAAPGKRWDYKKYQKPDGEWDLSKLQGFKDADKMLDQWMKDNQG